MKIAAFRKLQKIMEQTFSPNDNVALEGIRAANRILAEDNLTWERILNKTVNIVAEVEPAPEEEQYRPSAPKHVKDEGIESVLLLAEEAAERQSPKTQDFVASIRAQWEAKRWLSDRQMKALREVRDR